MKTHVDNLTNVIISLVAILISSGSQYITCSNQTVLQHQGLSTSCEQLMYAYLVSTFIRFHNWCNIHCA